MCFCPSHTQHLQRLTSEPDVNAESHSCHNKLILQHISQFSFWATTKKRNHISHIVLLVQLKLVSVCSLQSGMWPKHALFWTLISSDPGPADCLLMPCRPSCKTNRRCGSSTVVKRSSRWKAGAAERTMRRKGNLILQRRNATSLSHHWRRLLISYHELN